MELRKMMAFLALLAMGIQVFAQANKPHAVGKNNFCVGIYRLGDKPFVAEVSVLEAKQFPRSGYTTELKKIESKRIEKGRENAINLTASNNWVVLQLKDLHGQLIYQYSLEPNVCMRFIVLGEKTTGDQLSAYLKRIDRETPAKGTKANALYKVLKY